jgi:hypothetical protein
MFKPVAYVQLGAGKALSSVVCVAEKTVDGAQFVARAPKSVKSKVAVKAARHHAYKVAKSNMKEEMIQEGFFSIAKSVVGDPSDENSKIDVDRIIKQAMPDVKFDITQEGETVVYTERK